MHEEKWNIWNGTQAWGSSTSRGTTQHTGMGGQAQGMTQHAGGMESSTRHDTAHRHGSQAQGMTQHTRTWGQAQGMTQHSTQGMESSTRHDTVRRHGGQA